MVLLSIGHVSSFHVLQSSLVLSIYFVLKMCFCSLTLYCVVVCCSNDIQFVQTSFHH